MTHRQLTTLRILAEGGHLADDLDSDRRYVYPPGQAVREIEEADFPPRPAIEIDANASTGRMIAYRISDEGREMVDGPAR